MSCSSQVSPDRYNLSHNPKTRIQILPDIKNIEYYVLLWVIEFIKYGGDWFTL